VKNLSNHTGVNLKINQLRKSFGNTEVLKGINLELSSGEFVAIVGKSGSGKSTLLRHIAGLEQETNGSIIQGEKKIKGRNDKVRFMFQDDRLLPWLSVLENVGVGTGLKAGWKSKAEKALEQVGLKSREKEWPAVLSGGQKQRVALARALAAEPRLLLLDEPLGALDALTRMEMQELIEKLWLDQGYTSILVTHDVSEAVTLADRVIVLEDGQLKLDVAIDLPRPRHRSQLQYSVLEEKLLASILGKQVDEETGQSSERLLANV
jgi:sulfonate transport system ATP-binding protein